MININNFVESTGNDVFLNTISLIFLLVSSIIILINKEFRSSQKMFLIILVAVIIRMILIVINVFFIVLPGSDKDALGFIRDARELMITNEIPERFFGSHLYDYILSLVLKYGIDTILFVVTMNNIVFLISLILILKTLKLLDVSIKYRTLGIVILLLYPSLIFNTVSTLREPLQFLFITISAFIFIYLIKRRFSLSLFLVLNISIICLGLLHNGLLALTPLIIGIYIFSLYKYKKNRIVKVLISSVGLMFIIAILIAFTSGIISSPLVDSILEGNSTQYAEEYGDSTSDARASYKSEVTFSNPFTAIISSITVFLKYFLLPLPWQISSIQDIVPLFENIIRIIILWFIFKNWKLLDSVNTLLLLFLLIEFVWSLGTSNWGTASRHHIISSQLLIIIYVYLKYKVDVFKNERLNLEES